MRKSVLTMNSVQLPSRKAFLSAELQQQLEAEGYVKLSLLKQEQIANLLESFEKMSSPELVHPFYTSNWSRDVEYRKTVDAALRPILEQFVLPLLDRYKGNLSYFLVKRPSSESEFRVHQDWSMVNESEFTGLTLWVALSDTKVENGCFHVVPKSHLFSDHVRGSGIECPYSELKDKIESDYCVPLEMKKGEALIFDHRLWHFSPANLSGEERVAAGMVFIPMETSFLHYYLDTETGVIRTYQANDEFLIDNGFGDDISLRGYEVLDEKPFVTDKFDEKSFKDLFFRYNRNVVKPKRGLEKLVERLFG